MKKILILSIIMAFAMSGIAFSQGVDTTGLKETQTDFKSFFEKIQKDFDDLMKNNNQNSVDRVKALYDTKLQELQTVYEEELARLKTLAAKQNLTEYDKIKISNIVYQTYELNHHFTQYISRFRLNN
jgi:cell shape-determining protein MreC